MVDLQGAMFLLQCAHNHDFDNPKAVVSFIY